MVDGNYVPAAGGNSRAFSFHMATMRYIRRYTLDGNFTITKRKHTLNARSLPSLSCPALTSASIVWSSKAV